jgi:2'-5' RNA ligase
MQLAYALLVPDDVHNWMRRTSFELVERYGGRLSTVVPHVTIKNAFDAEAAEQYEQYLDRLAADTEPFELVLRGYGFFEAPGWVVFLGVEPSEELHALHRRVLDDLSLEPAQFEGPDFHFHATLALDLSPDEHARARAELTDKPTPEFRFPLERIGLARYAETPGMWTTYRLARVG